MSIDLSNYTITSTANGTIYFHKEKKISETRLTGVVQKVSYGRTKKNGIVVAKVKIDGSFYSCLQVKDFGKLIVGRTVSGTVRTTLNKKTKYFKNLRLKGVELNGKTKKA